MLIGIDLDDVLADFISALIKFHNEIYRTSLRKEHVFTYGLEKVWGGTREEAIEKIMDCYKSHYFSSILPVEGSVEAVSSLSKKNNLIIITSRHPIVKDKTINWLDKYFLKKFSEIYFTYNHWIQNKGKTKSEICSELGVDVLIEDSLEYTRECSANGTRVLLLNQPWNQSTELHSGIERVFSWNDVLEKLI